MFVYLRADMVLYSFPRTNDKRFEWNFSKKNPFILKISNPLINDTNGTQPHTHTLTNMAL